MDVAPPEPTESVERPVPVARYLEVTYPDGVPEIETVVVEGSGRFRRRPLSWIRCATGSRSGRDSTASRT